MRILKPLLSILTLALLCSCIKQDPLAQVQFDLPTIEQEATSIWRTINDIEFLESQGYQIQLPEHALIDSLIQKSRDKTFGNTDYPKIYALLESGIYDRAAYRNAMQKLAAQENLMNKLVGELKASSASWDWSFKTFSAYPIVLTLYGTGGSYDADSGQITLFTNQAGDYMQYDNPANTILHEVVHIGIEASIVQRFKLPHALKERVVDKITHLMFGDQLKDYKVQNMGYQSFDKYLNKREDIQDLPTAVQAFQKWQEQN